MKNLFDRIRKTFRLSEKERGAVRTLRARGMTFRLRGFYAEGFGHVSVMSASGFLGLMKMETLILNPFEREMPLLSYDRIHAMGKDSLYLELYDTMLQKTDLSPLDAVVNRFAHLPSFDPGSHWYDHIRLPQSLFKKGGSRGCEALFSEAAEEFLDCYLGISEKAPLCSPSRKRERAAAYSDGLLAHGGPAVDVFIKKFGRDATAELFREVLFGV